MIHKILLCALIGFPLVAAENDLPLMPWPAAVTTSPAAAAPVDNSFTIAFSGPGSNDPRVTDAAHRFLQQLSRQTGVPILPHIVTAAQSPRLLIAVDHPDHSAPQQLGDSESYSLDTTQSPLRINADHPLGALRALETLLQLASQNKPTAVSPGFSILAVTIKDEPRFAWRGLSLDVARHFMPIPVVERTLDGMSAVKLNVLHLHLADSEGFRLESKRYPRLTALGSDGLFYTQSEMRALIAYARDRGIRIVPEFDVPGHATSWLPGYPELGNRTGKFEIARGFDNVTDLIDPTRESTYRFLDVFIGEMVDLFPDKYFHVGGDEVDPKQWLANSRIVAFMKEHQLKDPAALQAYFNKRLLEIVTKHGKHMIGWDEILAPDLPKSIVVQSWRGQPALWQSARDGFSGILSAGYYLDLMYPASYHYSIDPMKTPQPAPGEEVKPDTPAPGQPSGLTPEQAKRILGGEAAMWDELATPENIDAKLWPRLAAIAERFWSPESITDVDSMYRRLSITNHRLEFLDLRQQLNLVRMRQRLAADFAVAPLNALASVLEPVKGYNRNAENYSMFSPLNRLVDSIPPESDAARDFRHQVDAFVSSSADQRQHAFVDLRDQLNIWLKASVDIKPMLQANSLLTEDTDAAAGLGALSLVGLAALDAMNHHPSSANWKENAQDTLKHYNRQRFADMQIAVAPAIQQLVEAAP